MPNELRFRPEALADLENIAHAVRRASGSATVARRHVARVLERCRHISTLPRSGRPRDDLAPGLRSVPFERRLAIVYRLLASDVVEITNIFYGASDYASLYPESVSITISLLGRAHGQENRERRRTACCKFDAPLIAMS